MVLDPDLGLFIGMRGQGFMLGQYLAKMYVDKLLGNSIHTQFKRIKIKGEEWTKRVLVTNKIEVITFHQIKPFDIGKTSGTSEIRFYLCNTFSKSSGLKGLLI